MNLVEAFAIDGQCTMTRHAHDLNTPCCYRMNCGMHWPEKLIELSRRNLGGMNEEVIGKAVAVHLAHHRDEHPVTADYSLLFTEHNDVLDGKWIVVECQH